MSPEQWLEQAKSEILAAQQAIKIYALMPDITEDMLDEIADERMEYVRWIEAGMKHISSLPSPTNIVDDLTAKYKARGGTFNQQ